MFRGAMVSLVFDHSIALSDHMNADNTAISHMSTGKPPLDDSTHDTEPGLDIDALSRSLVEINEFWARLIEVCEFTGFRIFELTMRTTGRLGHRVIDKSNWWCRCGSYSISRSVHLLPKVCFEHDRRQKESLERRGSEEDRYDCDYTRLDEVRQDHGYVCRASGTPILLTLVSRSKLHCRTVDTVCLLDRTSNLQRVHVADSGNEFRWYVSAKLYAPGTTNLQI